MTDRARAHPRTAPATGRRPVDASMTLINEVMRRPLDPGYQEAADRRRAAGNPPLRMTTRAWLAVLAFGLGVVTVTAALDLRAPEPAVAEARELLQDQIAERATVADRFQDELEATQQQVSELQTAAIGGQDPELLARLAADGVAAGAVAVSGPGLRVTVQDSDAVVQRPDRASLDERVQDVDLQIVVNGLWAAGAEAVAINGHRLTAVTAVRSAGSAILVDLIPLSGPYVVDAIGDPNQLATRFARTSAGQHLALLRNTYGISSQIATEDSLELAGSSGTRLWSATAPGEAIPDDVASSGPTDGGDGP
ncbi:DUF881 domain-containing protein [Cellulomonas fimi]|uniref:DUF881 domain-containing protein n=1 Tax=Cellulomonas fimi TaxID=1708 RepID=A0A7Y0QJ44_CELFI|nr:DUF881 domain-containing protein [Cellulomonas fimi]NMR21554.1 DUF881 domain-containing protein [Cellulomonas fimi]